MSTLSPPLSETLDSLAALTTTLQDLWWLLGSTAMVLAGATEIDPPDVDVLVSQRDAHALLAAFGAAAVERGGSDLFRSAVFGRTASTPLPIEIMAGLEVRTGARWRPVALETRIAVPQGGGALYIPDPAEQAALCRLFGRPKDLRRLSLLESLTTS